MTADIQLETLEAKGLIKLATMRPELEYLFRHALVQDAAYGSLLKQERRSLHGQVGEALETLYPERLMELSLVLAMHFEQAGEVEKAIDYLFAGAQNASRQYAIQEAFTALDRAATLSDQLDGEDGPAAAVAPEELERRGRRRIQIELGRTEAGYSFRQPEETAAALESIAGRAEELGDADLIVRLHSLLAMVRMMNGEPADAPEVRRSLERITAIGEQLGDPSIAAMPKAVVGLSAVFSWSPRDGVKALEESIPFLEDHWESISVAFARGGLAIGYAILGEFDKAEAAAKRASDIARRGDLIAQLDAEIAEGFVHSLKGDLDKAAPLARSCLERAEATGASACMVISSWILGDVFHRQGRFDEARDVLQRGTDVSLVVDRKVWRPTLQAWLGTAQVALGQADAADWDEGLATARSISNRSGVAQILWKQGEAAVARGDIEAATTHLRESAQAFEDLGARPYLARVLRALGEALLAAGRRDEAEPELRRALALFEDMGLEREAGITRTSLSIGGTKLAFS
jgi:tetratricopeptide (TPR) repeat protein